MRKLKTIVLGIAALIFVSDSLPLLVSLMAGSANAAEPPIVEIYEYTGKHDFLLIEDGLTIDEIKKNGKLLFTDEQIKDLKPVEGLVGRFTVEVRDKDKSLFWKTMFSGQKGEFVLVIKGVPKTTLKACLGCQAVDGSIDEDDLKKARSMLSKKK